MPATFQFIGRRSGFQGLEIQSSSIFLGIISFPRTGHFDQNDDKMGRDDRDAFLIKVVL